jgi:hypothetical protein
MTIDSRVEKLTLVFALGLPCLASLGLMFWMPGRVSPTTYAVVVSLLLGSTAVGLNTWKAAQATGSMGQLLYETNTGHTQLRRTGLSVATMVILSAVSTALIVATWLS